MDLIRQIAQKPWLATHLPHRLIPHWILYDFPLNLPTILPHTPIILTILTLTRPTSPISHKQNSQKINKKFMKFSQNYDIIILKFPYIIKK